MSLIIDYCVFVQGGFRRSVRAVDYGVAGSRAARERSRAAADRINLQGDGGADGPTGPGGAQTYCGTCTESCLIPIKRYKVIVYRIEFGRTR